MQPGTAPNHRPTHYSKPKEVPTLSTQQDDIVKSNPSPLDFHARVPDIILTHPDLSDYAVRLYAVMQSRAGERRWFWNTITELAEMTGKSRKSRESVYRATRQLEAINAIRVEHTYKENQNNGTAKYHLLDWAVIDADLDRTRRLMSNTPRLSTETPLPPEKNTPISEDRPRPYAVPHAHPSAENTSSSTPCSTTDVASDEQSIDPSAPQGKNKYAPNTGQLLPKKQRGELAHHPEDSVTDRVLRWVAYAIDVEYRDEARAWLTTKYSDWDWFDNGSQDRSWWVGALRQMIVGYDGHPAMNDTDIRDVIDAAKKVDHLDALVDYVRDGEWPSEPDWRPEDYKPPVRPTQPASDFQERAQQSWSMPPIQDAPWVPDQDEAPPW